MSETCGGCGRERRRWERNWSCCWDCGQPLKTIAGGAPAVLPLPLPLCPACAPFHQCEEANRARA